MTDLQGSTPDHDHQRHREILERTRLGLMEDLDDLRADLVDALDGFETRLRGLSADLPDWLDLPHKVVRTPFKLTAPSPLQDTLIGPRTVAIVAADLEAFFVEWLGDGDDIPAWKLRHDAEATKRLSHQLRDFDELLGETQEAVSALADDGPLQLEQTLESIVFDLQTRRETDVEALESMISDGDVPRGTHAREEIAELWEEQRNRVGELQRVWDDVLNLHHEGISRTLEGLDELEQLSERARQGIDGANIALPSPPVSTPASDDVRDDDASADASLSTPDPDQADSESDDAETSQQACDEQQPSTGPTIPDEFDAPQPATSPADSDSNPFLRATSEVETVSTDSPSSDTDVAEPSPQESKPHSPSAVDDASSEPNITQPSFEFAEVSDETADASATSQTADEASSSHTQPIDTEQIAAEQVDADQQDPSSTNAQASAVSPQPPNGDEQPASTELGDTVVPTTATRANSEASTATAQMEPDAPPAKIRVRAFRIREGWQTVSGDEIAITLGPAGLLVAVLLVLSLLSLVGLAENPMVLWNSAPLWAAYAAMAVLVCLPLLFGWRPMWRGTRFKVIRRGEVEEEVDLKVSDDNRLVLDRTAWPIDQIPPAEMHRWVFGDDDAVGWLLTISPPYHAPFHIATYADDLRAWKRSRADRCAPPANAWQVPPEEFEVLKTLLTETSDTGGSPP